MEESFRPARARSARVSVCRFLACKMRATDPTRGDFGTGLRAKLERCGCVDQARRAKPKPTKHNPTTSPGEFESQQQVWLPARQTSSPRRA
jgi:hypothetical protein